MVVFNITMKFWNSSDTKRDEGKYHLLSSIFCEIEMSACRRRAETAGFAEFEVQSRTGSHEQTVRGSHRNKSREEPIHDYVVYLVDNNTIH